MEKFTIPHKEKIYRFVLRMLGDVQDAEDVMQELAIRIWQRRDKFRQIDNQEAWCMKVARNLAIDKIRNRKKRQSMDITEAHDLSDHNRNPLEKLVSGDAMTLLHAWMAQLPDKQKEALHLREVEGMSYREIAEICEMSLEQVKSNIFRARQALKEIAMKQLRSKSSIF